MKTELTIISDDLNHGIIDEKKARTLLLGLVGVSGSCSSCKYWENPTYNRKEENVGRCSKLSGTHRKDTNTQDVYPELENTGIESVPICWHDGSGFDYETKSWFGCVHYIAR